MHYIMSIRKVSVCIYQYPKDYHLTFSIRHLFEVMKNEELIYHDKYLSDRPLYQLLQLHVDHVHDYALMCETEHSFRVVVRDSEDRLSISFRA